MQLRRTIPRTLSSGLQAALENLLGSTRIELVERSTARPSAPDDARSFRRLKAVENERDRTGNAKYWLSDSVQRRSRGTLGQQRDQSRHGGDRWLVRCHHHDIRIQRADRPYVTGQLYAYAQSWANAGSECNSEIHRRANGERAGDASDSRLLHRQQPDDGEFRSLVSARSAAVQ